MKILKMMTGCAMALALWGADAARAADVSYNNNTNLTVGAGDTLTVSSGNVDISYGGSGTGIGTRTLDASLADAVTFTIGSLRIGTRSDPTNTSTSNLNGTLNLGASNTITATSLVAVAGGGHVDGGALTTAASSTTTINTPKMDIGTLMRASGSFTTGAGSSLTVQGISGGRTALIVGEERNTAGGINWSGGGTMDLNGGQATLKLSSLVVGRSLFASSEAGTASGTLTMSSNVLNQLDISGSGSVVQIGVSAGNTTTGTMTVGNLGSASTITSTDNGTAILIGNRSSSGDAVSGTLNLNGGTVTITTTGAAIAGGSNATSNLNLSGGVKLIAGAVSADWIRNLATATLGTDGAVIDTNGNDIDVSQAFSGTGGLIKDGTGKLTLSGTQAYTGATEVKKGELSLTGSLHANSAVTVRSGAAISGTGTINGSLAFESNANLVYGATPLNVTGDVTFASGFSVANILGFDWALATLDTPYTLISGDNVNLNNLTQIDVATAGSVGDGRKAYFKEGSLQLVVIPEPATFGIVLGVLAAAILRRRRML
jgi:fibronectin-binding autotransporter adhesin